MPTRQVNSRVNRTSSGHRRPVALVPLDKLKAWKESLIGSFHQRHCLTEKKSGITADAGVSFNQGWFSPTEQQFLLELARASLTHAVHGTTMPGPIEPPAKSIEPRACFVTLTRNGALRGCLGNLQPRSSLYETIIENTRNAALRDPRFPPVQNDELSAIQIEITVLSDLQPLRFNGANELLDQLQPEHGVFLQIGERIATFLPQVWKEVPDRVDFLNRLAQKCGCPPSAWRQKGAQLSIYCAESFAEGD